MKLINKLKDYLNKMFSEKSNEDSSEGKKTPINSKVTRTTKNSTQPKANVANKNVKTPFKAEEIDVKATNKPSSTKNPKQTASDKTKK